MPGSSRPRAILLTGTVGSGKTTLLLEIGEVLEGLGEGYALVDLDWIAWLRPAPAATVTVDEVLVENLRAVWRTFRNAGVERLVLARFLDRRGQLDALRRALPGVELFVVRLAAPPQVVEERLRRRDTGGELDEHLAQSSTFAARAEAAGLENAVIESHGRPVREVALEILTAAGWPAGSDPAQKASTTGG